MKIKNYSMELDCLLWHLSIKPISKCSFARKKGYEGKNILFHNLLISRKLISDGDL